MAGWALQSPECIDLVDVVSNATEHPKMRKQRITLRKLVHRHRRGCGST
jgi:hypothetical protein